MPNSAARWRRWISPGAGRGQFRRAAPGGRPRSDLRGRAVGATQKRIEELEVFAEELVAKLDAQDEGKVSAAAETDRGAPTAAFSGGLGRRTDPLRESRLSGGSFQLQRR